MALDLQPKLLRVLQERELQRVGGSQTFRTNARIVAATNCSLPAMLDRGAFREDLFYRLAVFPIHLPPLRERKGDVSILAHAFVRKFAEAMHKETPVLGTSVLAKLDAHDWPGNVRELQNVIERAVIVTRGGAPLEVVIAERSPARSPSPSEDADALTAIDRAHILSVLRKTNGVVGGPNGAAVRLGMKRSTLNFRMKKLGIRRGDE